MTGSTHPTAAAGLEALADRLADGSGPAVLVAGDLQLHPAALAELTQDPRPTTAALVARAGDGDLRASGPARLRRRGGRVVSVGTPDHEVTDPDGVFAGALRVGAGERATAAAAARSAAGTAARLGWAGDPLDLLLLALVRGGLPVAAVVLDPWPWRRGAEGPERTDFAARVEATGAEEVHRTRLARATKADDGLVASFLSRPVARRLTPVALRLGLTPNAVTVASLLVGLAAAALFGVGDRWALVAGAVLLQLSLVVDCVDGDVARYTRRFSATGAWLDASTDRLKEFACYAGLAWGAGGADGDAWTLAVAMLTLQTARHSIDYTFTAVKEDREGESGVLPLDEPVDAAAAAAGSASARAVQASERSNRKPAVRWTKKALHLGIGERWLVISVLAALGLPTAALVALLCLGAVSLAYTSAGRVLRTRTWPRTRVQPPSARERSVVAAQADLAPVVPPAVATGALTGRPDRFLWLRPAVLRAVEYACVALVVAAVAPDGLLPAYALLLVVASHHYDDLYRVVNRLDPPAAWSSWLGLGGPGRVATVLLLAAAGGGVLVGGLWVLAALLGILYLVVEPLRVLREVRAAPTPAPEVTGG
ncbi:MAG TPA: DUF5941 domain-containing protein [Actinomycetes bacterium]|nr:DUF5941 domain-containing protein [Actinomycetes bacterium]